MKDIDRLNLPTIGIAVDEEVAAVVRRRAVRAVAARARSAAECRDMLDMLGLQASDGKAVA